MVLGLLAASGLPLEVANRLARELPGVLARRFPEAQWRVVVEEEPIAGASHSDVDLVQVARQRMLAAGWKLAVCLTDYPVHVRGRPVTAHASASSGVGLVSVPALGAVNLDRRVRSAVLRVIEGLLGESVNDREDARDAARDARMRGRVEELASTMGHAEVREDRTVQFVAAVGLGDLRLLLGMIRANRPWRLIAGLSRAIVGALGLAVFGVASPGVWMIADGLGWERLLALAVASILAICVSLITAHRLWDSADATSPEARERLVLFNVATAVTVALGVLSLYVSLFVINAGAAATLIPRAVLEKNIGHPAGAGTYLALAWLVTSLATVGGALGAALESDRAVREAAYGYREDAHVEAPQSQDAAHG